jgi:glycosidase
VAPQDYLCVFLRIRHYPLGWNFVSINTRHATPGRAEVDLSYDQEAKAWYFHRFYDFQPDLNTSHSEVQAEILKIMGFWIQLGVSGFRMDAVPFIIATNGSDQARIAAMLLLTLRGTPTVYYGDEIAMRDVAIAPTQVRDPLGNARLAITKEQYYGCGKGCQRDQCVCARTASPELTAIPHRRTRASKHGHGNRLGWRCRRAGRCCHQPDPLGGRRFGATGTFRHRNRWCSIA